MRKLVKIALWFFLGLAFFLVVYLPAPMVWNLYANKVPLQNYSISKVDQVKGSVWNGRASIISDYGEYNLSWKIAPLRLLTLQLAAEIILESDELELSGLVSIGQKNVDLAGINGWIDSEIADQFLLSDSVKTQYPIEIKNINVQWAPYKPKFRASGQAILPAGNAEYSVFGLRGDIDFPALTLLLNDDGDASVTAQLFSEQKLLLDATLSAPGGYNYRVYRALANTISFPLPGTENVINQGNGNLYTLGDVQ